MNFLAELDPESKPDAIAFVEVHLRGTDLSATRRRVRKLGWRMMATSAVTKAQLRAAAGEQPREQGGPEQVEHEDHEEASSAKYHNSGGEAILVNPGRVATGYHQPKEAFGYRSRLDLAPYSMLLRLWLAIGSWTKCREVEADSRAYYGHQSALGHGRRLQPNARRGGQLALCQVSSRYCHSTQCPFHLCVA